MEQAYPHLFTPLQVGNTIFRNRWFTSPTHHCLQGDEKAPTEAAMAYYGAKARGGAAVVTVGGVNIFRDHLVDRYHPDYDIYEIPHLRYFTQLVDTIHFYGAKASLELSWPGGIEYNPDTARGKTLYAPSAYTRGDGLRFEEMPEAEMERIAGCYADAAFHAKWAGFDMILIHGGHGLGLQQFLSPLTNHRTDRYGGSLENRARFPMLVLDRIRERVGRELLIEYRVSGSERTPGGLEVEECAAFTALIEDKIDLIHVSAGTLANSTRAIMHPSCFLPPAPNAYLAEYVKQSGVHIPVVTVGAIYDPEVAEAILAGGKADVVTMCRGAIADPDVVNKARSGHREDIRPCIKCYNCLDDFKKTNRFSCSVNPVIGRQHRLPWLVQPPGPKKKAVVVGGGPAGLQALLTCRERGHEVVLFERADTLGGQLSHVDQVSFKYDLKAYRDYLVRQAVKSGAELRLGCEATPELVRSLEPDAVFAALGARPVRPPIPGAVDLAVLTAPEAFHRVDEIGAQVVVIGGGQVGCELGLHLAELGRRVTILELQDRIALDAIFTHRTPLVERLDAALTYHVGAWCTGIAPGRVSYTDAAGASRTLTADTVILAVGMEPRIQEAEAFCATAFDFFRIGDCVKPANIKMAVRTAFDAASQL